MNKYHYIRKTFTYAGKRYEVRGKTEREALQKLIQKQNEVERGNVRGGSVTVRAWAERVLEAYKPNVSDEYKRQMQYRLDNHILPVIGSMLLKDVTPLDCQMIVNAQKGKSKSHITKLSQELSFIFKMAVRNDLIAKNPAEELEKPAGTNRKRRALTADEREHLLKVIPQDDRFVFFLLMLYCGCRPSEAADVRFEDVCYIDGIPFLHIRGTKTANSDRLVPVAEEVKPLLLSGKTGLVSTNAAGKHHHPSSYRSMCHYLERCMNISMGAKLYRNELIPPLPLADDFVPYLLRHTFCTDLKKKGVDVRIAKNLMGHADIKTTANIYDHDDDETLILAAQQMHLA